MKRKCEAGQEDNPAPEKSQIRFRCPMDQINDEDRLVWYEETIGYLMEENNDYDGTPFEGSD